MMFQFLQLMGPISQKLLKKSRNFGDFFDYETGNFLNVEKNKITGVEGYKMVNMG